MKSLDCLTILLPLLILDLVFTVLQILQRQRMPFYQKLPITAFLEPILLLRCLNLLYMSPLLLQLILVLS